MYHRRDNRGEPYGLSPAILKYSNAFYGKILTFILILAGLVSYRAAGLAGGLAGCLALATAPLFHALS